jgi:hypothetical protein
MGGRFIGILIVAACLACPLAAQQTTPGEKGAPASDQTAQGNGAQKPQPGTGASAADASAAQENPKVQQSEIEKAEGAPTTAAPEAGENASAAANASAGENAEEEEEEASLFGLLGSAAGKVEQKVVVQYGATFLSAYEFARSSGGNNNGATYLVPFFALGYHAHRVGFMVTYTPAISYIYPPHVLKVDSAISGLGGTGLFFHGKLSRRWSWGAGGDANCGDAYTPQWVFASTPVEPGSVATIFSPQITPTMLSFVRSACLFQAQTDLSWARKRSAITLVYDPSYSTQNGVLRTAYATGVTRIQFDHHLDPRTSVYSYGQIHDYYIPDSSECMYFGVGGGMSQIVNHQFSWRAEGGPQYGHCLTGWNYGVNLKGVMRWVLSPANWVVVTGGRDLNATYLVGGIWADVVSATVYHGINPKTTAGLNCGYVRSVPPSTQATSGSYLTVTIVRKVGRHTDATLGFGSFERSGSYQGVSSDSKTLWLSMYWHPKGIPLPRVLAQMH